MYIVLTGAKKNVGDYLITDRTKKLLKHLRPEHDLVQIPYWFKLDQYVDLINQSSAIILMGGPGLDKNFYPGIYKLVSDLNSIEVPIIPLGLGWMGFPGDYQTVNEFQFSNESKEALLFISEKISHLSCRDYITMSILKRNGINNALMTGCPVWYDLKSINKKMNRPKNIKKVVFTPPQRHIYREQCIEILKLLKKIFPNSDLYCSFHRGIYSRDIYTPKNDETNNLLIQKAAEELGYKIIDASFNLEKIRFYEECDLHIGYRVHGHLYLLSKRKPSILIHEDGRGIGVSEALSLKGINAFERVSPGKTEDLIIPNPYLLDIVKDYLEQELSSNFSRFTGVGNVIDTHYQIMKKFINNLPDNKSKITSLGKMLLTRLNNDLESFNQKVKEYNSLIENMSTYQSYFSMELLDFLHKSNNLKLAIFGTGKAGEELFYFIEEFNQKYQSQLQIAQFFDNNQSKWDKEFCGKIVLKPTREQMNFDSIIIASSYKEEIRNQLISLEVPYEKIVTVY